MPVITISAILGGASWVAVTALNTVFSTMQHFGYPPFALFMIALLYFDINNNWIGGTISLITDLFFNLKITSFILFMFIIITLIIWFFWKVRQFHSSGAYSR